jgi:hypothetical protein
VNDQVSQPYKTTGKILVLVYFNLYTINSTCQSTFYECTFVGSLHKHNYL